MAKFLNDSVLDVALDKIATATSVSVCSAQPTTRAEAVTTYMLATKTITGAAFTKADGDTSGRKTTLAAQTALPVTGNGSSTHYALTDGSTLLAVGIFPSPQTLVSGNTVDLAAIKVAEISDIS